MLTLRAYRDDIRQLDALTQWSHALDREPSSTLPFITQPALTSHEMADGFPSAMCRRLECAITEAYNHGNGAFTVHPLTAQGVAMLDFVLQMDECTNSDAAENFVSRWRRYFANPPQALKNVLLR